MKVKITYLKAYWGADGVGRVTPDILIQDWPRSSFTYMDLVGMTTTGIPNGSTQIMPGAILSVEECK